MVLSGEQRLALQHLGKDAAGTPDIDLNVVLLPREHDLGRSIISGRDITRHLRILDAREAEIADLQVAVLIDQDVAGFKVAMDDTCGVDIFQATLSLSAMLCSWLLGATYHDLVKEILDELLLERPRGQKPVQIGAKKLGDKVATAIGVSHGRDRFAWR